MEEAFQSLLKGFQSLAWSAGQKKCTRMSLSDTKKLPPELAKVSKPLNTSFEKPLIVGYAKGTIKNRSHSESKWTSQKRPRDLKNLVTATSGPNSGMNDTRRPEKEPHTLTLWPGVRGGPPSPGSRPWQKQ